jgi:hypothetical protein
MEIDGPGGLAKIDECKLIPKSIFQSNAFRMETADDSQADFRPFRFHGGSRC